VNILLAAPSPPFSILIGDRSKQGNLFFVGHAAPPTAELARHHRRDQEAGQQQDMEIGLDVVGRRG
jgi:hypothetical protein